MYGSEGLSNNKRVCGSIPAPSESVLPRMNGGECWLVVGLPWFGADWCHDSVSLPPSRQLWLHMERSTTSV